MRHKILTLALAASFHLSAQIPDFKPPTPLFAAVLNNDTAAVKQLLEQGADPNEGNFFGNPALVLAIINGNREMVRAMLAKGADANGKDRHGSTALMWSVGMDSPNRGLVEDLLAGGADPGVQNNMGESALNWALRRGDMQAVERLKAAGASDAGAIRASVEKAVALLQKSGPQFVKVSGCVSCHHQSLPQMAYALARGRGFQVDPVVSDKQVKAVMAMFKPIREQMEQGTVTLPNPGISVSYSLLGLAAEGYAPDAVTSAMAMTIERTQLPDGSFAVLPARPPMEASPFTSTALSIRALQTYGKDTEGRIAKARAWLMQARPATNEDRTMRVLGLVWAKADRKAVEQASADLLAWQRADGGWGQLANLETDAYATGQALVALHESGALTPQDHSYQQGVMFLLRTQLADGSWLVRTRSSPFQPLKESGFPHGRNEWISAAGTSWAAMALALSQPKLERQTLQQPVPSTDRAAGASGEAAVRR